jgi:uncharacterized protein (DUF983 family)
MSFLSKVLSGKCPNCEQEKMFKTNGNPFIFKMPVMNKTCSKCGYVYERETGFFFGAMYISYALTCAQMIAIFVLGLIFGISFLNMFIAILVIAFALSTFNYKLARIIWLNIFYKKM